VLAVLPVLYGVVLPESGSTTWCVALLSPICLASGGASSHQHWLCYAFSCLSSPQLCCVLPYPSHPSSDCADYVSCLLHRCINNASPAFPSNFKKALEEFDVNEDGLIDYQEFGQIDARYPLVLFPAFRLQDVMQRNSLGKRLRCAVLTVWSQLLSTEFWRVRLSDPPDHIVTFVY
jgi:hypothetical protein